MFRIMKLAPALLPAIALGIFAGMANAQDATAPQDDPYGVPAGQEMVDLYTDADAAAVLNARIVALKTVLELTADQEKLWEPVEASIRKIAADAAARNTQRQTAEPPMDFLDVLDRMADAEAVRAADLKSFVAAARPLVTALSEEQKRRAPAFLGLFDPSGGPQPIGHLWLFEDEQG